MGDNSQLDIEDDDLDNLDDFDDDADIDDSDDDDEVLAKDVEAAEQRRIAARREIERRAEEKALNSRLDEWEGDLDEWDPNSDEWDEDDL